MRLSIQDGVIFETLDDETIILNVNNGSYFRLNPTGTRVWKWIEEHGNRQRIEGLLAETYDLTPEVAQRDLGALLGELQELGLVRADDS